LIKNSLLRNYTKVVYLTFVVIILFILFAYIKASIKPSLFLWDESSYALSSLEMSQTNNFLIPTSGFTPSIENTKPTLVLIMQSLSIKVFGVNEFAVRLPTIIFTIALVGLCYITSHRFFRNRLISLLSSLILSLFIGFFSLHIALTGDLDGVFSFFATLTCIWYYYIFHNKQHINTIDIIYLFILIMISFFSKSIAIFLLTPSLLLFSLLYNKSILIANFRKLIIGVLLTLILIIVYFIVVEKYSSGNFNRFINSDLKRYLNNVMPWHEQPSYFYFRNLLYNKMYPFIFLCPLILYVLIDSRKRKLSNTFFSFSVFVPLIYLFVISIPKVKLLWYDAPIYPFCAFAFAYSFTYVIKKLKDVGRNLFASGIIILGLFFVYAIFKQYENFKSIKNIGDLEREGALLKSVCQKYPNLKQLKILMKVEHLSHYDQINFYREKFRVERKLESNILTCIKDIKFKDTILVSQKIFIDSLSNHQFAQLYTDEKGQIFTKVQ
jgi:4-amino-4-deoxy-L-arabinose transferase-like glycosyltransferase